MNFYNVKTREKVEVPDDQVEVVIMKNGRKAAKAEVEGTRLFKMLSNAEAERLS
ncbi:MAG: hypothetical protein ACT4OM_03325 [Actinomycetota bacterium]